jgi:hypothetical protein
MQQDPDIYYWIYVANTHEKGNPCKINLQLLLRPAMHHCCLMSLALILAFGERVGTREE